MHPVLIIVLSFVGSLILGLIISIPIVNTYLVKKFFHRVDEEWIYKVGVSGPQYSLYRDSIIENSKKLESLNFKFLSIENDGLTLYGKYYKGTNGKLVIFSHGIHSIPSYNFGKIALKFIENGYSIFIIIHRAHGMSGGDYCTFGIKEQYDLIKWINYLNENLTEKEYILYGVSMGASIIGYASDKIDCKKVKFAVMDCGFSSVEKAMTDKLVGPTFLKKTIFYFYNLFCRIIIKSDLYLKVTDSLKDAKFPILFFHGKEDTTVNYLMSEENFSSANCEKDIFISTEGTHTTSVYYNEKEYYEKLNHFISKYLGG